MLQSTGQTAVIDTADWALIVPIRPPLNLTGSRLRATLAPARGGPPACTIDSADGSISWVADASGVSDYLIIRAAKSLRGSWQATLPTSVFFDVHRSVVGSAADEWLGRTNVLVLPGSDSSIVTQPQASGFVLIPGQPCTGVLLPTLQTGPQGPPGPPGASGGGAGSAQIFSQATPAATWVIPHGFGRRPLVAVYDASGAELLADIIADAAAATVTFAQPTAGSAVLA